MKDIDKSQPNLTQPWTQGTLEDWESRFEPPIVRSQWFDLFRPAVSWSGEEKLLSQVFAKAVEDGWLAKPYWNTGVRKANQETTSAKYRRSAHAWVRSNDAEGLSFVAFCRLVKAEPSDVRQILAERGPEMAKTISSVYARAHGGEIVSQMSKGKPCPQRRNKGGSRRFRGAMENG